MRLPTQFMMAANSTSPTVRGGFLTVGALDDGR
jgi:hypothetical protein